MSSARSAEERAPGRRKRRKAKPLDETALRDLALSYAARFATSGAKLEAYLARKIRERGVAEDGDGREVRLDVPGLVARLIELGYVDDAAYARARARDLNARGYGARRIDQALYAAGIDEGIRSETAPTEAESRRAAVLMAKKRRFGPFGRESVERAVLEKQIAAMLRAGHGFDIVRFIIHSDDASEVEAWLEEAEEEARDEGGAGTW